MPTSPTQVRTVRLWLPASRSAEGAASGPTGASHAARALAALGGSARPQTPEATSPARGRGAAGEAGSNAAASPPDAWFVVGDSQQRSGGARVDVPFVADEIYEIEEDDGFVHWVRADELPVLDADLGVAELPPPPAGASTARNGAAYRTVRKLAVDVGTRFAVKEIVQRFERRHVERLLGADETLPAAREAGTLVEVTGDGRLRVASARRNDAGPWLLFIHGTVSTFDDGFAGFMRPDGTSQTPLERLARDYTTDGGAPRVLAFEHPTLTKSPIDNLGALAAQLAAVVPDHAELHVISHSRGGLVGELLALATDPAARLSAALAADVHAARLALGSRRVVRFVRVACPARGTLLASERLDRWATVMRNLAEKAAGLVPPPYDGPVKAIVDLATALAVSVIAERKDPDVLPGLEAMMPSSPFVAALDGCASEAPLVAIGSDYRVRGFKPLAHLSAFAMRMYYREPHDIVVHRAAMDGGAKRFRRAPDGNAEKVEISTVMVPHEVTHFTYFANDESRRIVLDALVGPVHRSAPRAGSSDRRDRGALGSVIGLGTLESFRSVPGHQGARASTLAADRGTVVILPGFPGSMLARTDDEPVWLGPQSLGRDAVRALDLRSGTALKATDVVPNLYNDLARHLVNREKLRVVTFGYDWRLGVAHAGERLLALLNALIAGGAPRVTLVAHSTGGLVARYALAGVGETGRPKIVGIVCLGTPHGGTWAALDALDGRWAGGAGAALLTAFGHDRARRREVAGQMQTLYDLLPDAAATAARLNTLTGGAVDEKSLEERKSTLAQVRRTDSWLPKLRVNVLGQADDTPHYSLGAAGLERSADAPLRARAGDGTVLDESARLDGWETRYVRAKHAALPNHRDVSALVAEAHRDGRVTGATSRVADARSRGDGGGEEREERSASHDTQTSWQTGPPWRPRDSAQAAEWLFGLEPTGSRQAREIRLRVTHGNLRHAGHPLIVGQLRDEPIRGAQGDIDRLYGRALSRMRALTPDRYPGGVGTAHLFKGERRFPPCTVVVGMGEARLFNEDALQRALVAGLLEIAQASRTRDGELKASLVLVGSSVLAADVATSVRAVLDAVDVANRRLDDHGGGRTWFGEIEIIEMWGKRAANAWRAARELLSANGDGDDAAWTLEARIHAGEGGRPGEPSNMWDRDRWLTLQVDTSGDALSVPGQSPAGLPLPATARWEQLLIGTSAALERQDVAVHRGLLASVGTAGTGREVLRLLCGGVALFNLLVGASYKGAVAAAANLRLVLSPAAARLPWELMEPEPDSGRDPWGVRTPIIRQLDLGGHRPVTLQAPLSRTALVVGDPDTTGLGYARLPGAAQEARAVEKALEIWCDAPRDSTRGSVFASVSGSGPDIVRALFCRRPQVLHIAAHGVAPDAASGGPGIPGVLLGARDAFGTKEALWFTPEMVAQLRSVPDVVFLNCCEVGAVGEAEPTPEVMAQRRLRSAEVATGLAAAFMAAGCRVLVAAAWSIDDSVARSFAERFYAYMLCGRSFGYALREARRAAFELDRRGDSWAAYQAYGDPEFRLEFPDDDLCEVAGAKGAQVLTTDEAVDAFERTRHDSTFAYEVGSEGPDPLRWGRRVTRLREHARETWRGLDAEIASDPSVAWAAARCFGALLDWDAAIALLETLVPGADGSAAPTAPNREGAAALEHLDAVRAVRQRDDGAVHVGATRELANLWVRRASLVRFGTECGAPRAAEPGGSGGSSEALGSATRRALTLLEPSRASVLLKRATRSPSSAGDASEFASAEALGVFASTLTRWAREELPVPPGGNERAGGAAGSGTRVRGDAASLQAAADRFERASAAYSQAVDRALATRGQGAAPTVSDYGAASTHVLAWAAALMRGDADTLERERVERARELRALLPVAATAETSVWKRVQRLEVDVALALMGVRCDDGGGVAGHDTPEPMGAEERRLAWDKIVDDHVAALLLGATPREADTVADRVRLYFDVVTSVEAHGSAAARQATAGAAEGLRALHAVVRPPYP